MEISIIIHIFDKEKKVVADKSTKEYKETLKKFAEKLYFNTLVYKDDIDLVDKIVSLYSIIKTKDQKKRILPFEKEVLIYYIIFGFTKEAKEEIKREKKKNENQINTTNSNLRKKGYLFKDDRNMTKGYVAKDLMNLVNAFKEDPEKFYTIKFTKK